MKSQTNVAIAKVKAYTKVKAFSRGVVNNSEVFGEKMIPSELEHFDYLKPLKRILSSSFSIGK